MASVTGTVSDGLSFVVKQCRTECKYTFRIDHYPGAKPLQYGWRVDLGREGEDDYIFLCRAGTNVMVATKLGQVYQVPANAILGIRPHDESEWILT